MKVIDQPAPASLPLERPLGRKKWEAARPSPGRDEVQLRIHRCLCLLIGVLIFEGLARKLVPPSLGILIFFSKDLLVVLLLVLSLTAKPNAEAARWLTAMTTLLVLLLPCIISTAFHDPVLAVFGVKQYVLFPTITIAACAAYLPNQHKRFAQLFRLIMLTVIFTTSIAVAQNRLPASSWLNLSVAGEDLSAFSAGGYLRVSSTFPFVGQYCYYLNALCFCLPAFYYFETPPRSWVPIIQGIVLIGLIVTGVFVTGSRLAVVGNAAILGVSGLLLAVFGKGRALFKLIFPAAVGVALLGLLQHQYPQLFTAYQTRMGGAEATTHKVEILDRVQAGLLDWTDGSAQAPPSFLGYGLGVMSNGSEKLSQYAAQWRNDGFWTETDQATTFFEGGWYLAVVWYGFRLWVIVQSLVVALKMRILRYRLIMCFSLGFIIIVGVTGTLAIQPPVAIWWWLAVGVVMCLGQFDRHKLLPKPLLRS